jgi:hypothetical protein
MVKPFMKTEERCELGEGVPASGQPLDSIELWLEEVDRRLEAVDREVARSRWLIEQMDQSFYRMDLCAHAERQSGQPADEREAAIVPGPDELPITLACAEAPAPPLTVTAMAADAPKRARRRGPAANTGPRSPRAPRRRKTGPPDTSPVPEPMGDPGGGQA